MILKFLFDRVVALIGLLFLWPVLLVVAILVKIKMPGGPAFFAGTGGRVPVPREREIGVLNNLY